MADVRLLQGNEAVVEGAMLGGLTFFAGYPITPSTEVAEGLARKLPKVGGKFIQMEDEIASMAAIIGAACTGAKTMTATSGPGFSLMQENLGYAYIAEVPCVIVNVQRGGPSTGLPTKVAQADTMQARWGTHGDYVAIALAPQSVEETIMLTIRAMNLSEEYRTPVILLLDEVLGHMREKVVMPEPGSFKVVNRTKPTVPANWYKHFEITPSFKSPMASFGDGYRFHVTGLTHNEEGFPTSEPKKIHDKLFKLQNKIMRYVDHICDIETDGMEDAHVAVVAYGNRRPCRQTGNPDGAPPPHEGRTGAADHDLADTRQKISRDLQLEEFGSHHRRRIEPGSICHRDRTPRAQTCQGRQPAALRFRADHTRTNP